MFVQIIHDPPTEEVSIMFCNESLQIAFPNNVLVSKFQDECGQSKTVSLRAARKKRGRVSRAH